jgi:hypothetical protein
MIVLTGGGVAVDQDFQRAPEPGGEVQAGPGRTASAKFGYSAGSGAGGPGSVPSWPGVWPASASVCPTTKVIVMASTPSVAASRRMDSAGSPRDLFTIAIIEDADPEEIPMWMARIAPVEERRHEGIRHLVGEPTLNAVYQVVAEDDLSRPIPA